MPHRTPMPRDVRRPFALWTVAIVLGLACVGCPPATPTAAPIAASDPAPQSAGPPSVVLSANALSVAVPSAGVGRFSLSATVGGITLSETGARLRFFINGHADHESIGDSPWVVEDLGPGLHDLAAQLIENEGAAIQSPKGFHQIRVYVRPPCTSGDECDDQRVCTKEACTAGRCRYILSPGCCDHPTACATP